MAQNEATNDPMVPPKKDRTRLFLGLTVLFVVILIIFYYQYSSLQDERDAQAKELSETLIRLDSIGTELDDKIATIRELGGEVDTLLKVKEEMQAERKLLLTEIDNRKRMMATLRGKVEGYTELLLEKDAEIAQLKKMNEVLITENNELKTEKQELNASIQEINKAKDQLAEQVAFASRLKAGDFKIYAVSEGGREREGEFRNRHADRLRVTFTVSENEVAPIEGKELLVRIVAPDGNVLFDVTRGSGTFMFEGRELFYSASQEILYDKNSQEVSLYYDKGSEYTEGQHQVEVYTDEYLMGKGTFLVK